MFCLVVVFVVVVVVVVVVKGLLSHNFHPLLAVYRTVSGTGLSHIT